MEVIIKTEQNIFENLRLDKGPFRYYVIKRVGGVGQMIMVQHKVGILYL